jgi:hypothetical protein
MKVRNLRLLVEELEGKVVITKEPQTIKEGSKQAVLIRFISGVKGMLEMLATAKRNDEEFASLVSDAQSIINTIKNEFYDLNSIIEDLNEFLDDSISTDNLDTAIDELSDEVDYSEIKELDEDEVEDLEVDEAFEMVEGDYNE